jgi:ferredoxin/flavodoxin---NADP+ reductase
MTADSTSDLHAAIVGAGPSGFYAAEALLRKRPGIRVDMFDRLPTPFGLVRGGVAPDHPKIKQVALTYDKIARSPGFAFCGNVEIGTTLSLEDLTRAYHIVVLAYGASADRPLRIPGEDLRGSHTATEFVGWYNGQPDYRNAAFDLSGESAVVIGQGNVAADVARMLATPIDELRGTDITEQALEALGKSRIRNIHVIGRRGPAQAKFTSVELKELGRIRDCAAVVSPEDLELNPASVAELADPRADESRKNLESFRTFAAANGKGTGKRILFHFCKTPVRISGSGKVEQITLAHSLLHGPAFAQTATATSHHVDIPCDIVFRSVGYRGLPMPGLGFDVDSGIIPNRRGRCLRNGEPIRGVYVAGWIKRGPTGIIGTNRADSLETVECILEDLAHGTTSRKPGIAGLGAALAEKKIISYADWQKIDAAERARGQPKGKPREKFTALSDLIAATGT